MKSLFNRLAGVAVVGAVLYSCASIGRNGNIAPVMDKSRC